MNRSIILFTLCGVRVRVHASWLLAAALITATFGLLILPQSFPWWGAGRLWLTSFLAALSLAASVLIHEFAHTFAARILGIKATSITLFVFGGVSAMESETTRPRDEFLIAIVGPLSSILIGVVAGAGVVLMSLGEAAPRAGLELPATSVGVVLFYLAAANIVLGAFNLAPAFPLDGGRILSAALWAVTGDRWRALSTAAIVGQIGAAGLIAFGCYQIIFGSLLSGFWLIGVGLFLMEAASSTGNQARHLRRRGRGIVA